MKKLLIFLLVLAWASHAIAQEIEPKDVTIVRDSFGVPHIFGETNEDVAYGMAWVQCEDQFETMQEILAACRGMLGQIKGKQGVIADIGIQYMNLASFVEDQYEEQVQGEFRSYLESYVSGVNKYAESHPERVLLKKLFPISGKDVITGYLLGNAEISGARRDLQRILNGNIKTYAREDQASAVEKGSNAFAFSDKITKDGSTYLAINSHQPLEGWYSWYEVHLHSKEGLNIIGGTFAGGVSVFLGANEHLGWAHTVNHADFSDVYELTVSEDGQYYELDGEWKPLQRKKAKAKLKTLGFLNIPISRTYYETVYGPAFKTNKGYFAWSFMAGRTLKMAEQWWRMNLAQNFEEFREALKVRGIVSTNIVYADKSGNIFYVSNGSIPDRNPKFDWDGTLPGNTSETQTSMENLIAFDSLPQLLNPPSGWVFNTNNTPFTSSAPGYSPSETPLNEVMGYQQTGKENNRSVRFLELMEGKTSYDYSEFKELKYDNQYPKALRKVRGLDVNVLFKIKAEDHPEIADLIEMIQNWNKRTNIENEGATAFLATIYAMNELDRKKMQREELAIAGLKEAKSYLKKQYGKLKVPLGEFQKHARFDKEFPMAGAPDVLAALYCVQQKDGTYRAVGGESYIAMVRLSEDGVTIESINAYGNSEVEGDPYATSQMEMFATQQLKPMTFNKEKIFAEAREIYHPQRRSE